MRITGVMICVSIAFASVMTILAEPGRQNEVALRVTAVSAKQSSPSALTDDLNLAAMVQPVSKVNIFGQKDWYVWCGDAIRGEDGKYHMFYARWPKKYGFTCWLTHSEIAHAVAENPAGPYRHLETVLRGSGSGWDAWSLYNAKIKRFGEKYYLYYSASSDVIPADKLVETARIGYKAPLWMPLRNAQRSGVAVAGSLSGPWKRSVTPCVEPAGPITKLTVNPGVCEGPDGKYYMIIKGDKPGSRKRNQAIAIADTPEGPFVVQPKPAIEKFDTEDASIWYDKVRRRFYAIYHAHTHIGMITSVDGLNWTAAKHRVVLTKTIKRSDSKSPLKTRRLERPGVLFDADGQPLALLVACMVGKETFNLQVPLEK